MCIYAYICAFMHTSSNTCNYEFTNAYMHTYVHTYMFIHIHSYLHRGKIPNECPRYDTKQFDAEAPVMLKFWGMRSTPSLPSLPSLLRPGVVAPDRVLSKGQIELNCALMLNWIVWKGTVFDIETVLTLNWIVWNRTVSTFKRKTILIIIILIILHRQHGYPWPSPATVSIVHRSQ